MTSLPIPGETWPARATHATAEIVEVRAAEGSVVYRRSEPGFPHVGLPWCTPLALFLDAFAPPERHHCVSQGNVPRAAAKSTAPATGAEILRRFDVAEAPKPCCRRIFEGWCYLDAGHDGMCITAPPRALPVSDFGPGRANRSRLPNT